MKSKRIKTLSISIGLLIGVAISLITLIAASNAGLAGYGIIFFGIIIGTLVSIIAAIIYGFILKYGLKLEAKVASNNALKLGLNSMVALILMTVLIPIIYIKII